MRVIIIEDKDGMALLDSLKLEKMQLEALTADGQGSVYEKQVIAGLHRKFHYVVVKWLQANGWKIP